MSNYAWVLEVRPGYEDEYKKRHDEIWPEMVQMLSDAGLRNYNIFRHGLTLFGYFETDDLKKSIDHIVKSEVNKKWGEYMSDILKAEVDPKTRMLSVIASVGKNNPEVGNQVLVGQYAQASITGVEINDVYVIPRNNIRNQSLWVVNSNMELINRPVSVLRYENEYALVNEGIEEGDRLLTSRLSSLINGQKVTYSIN